MATPLLVCAQVMLTMVTGMQDPGRWTSRDVGNVATAGTAQYNREAGIWTVQGDGSDIWSVADSFQYVYQPCRGDGFIVARVESINGTASWAKCGVMLRESTHPASRFIAVYATPGEGVRFQARIMTGDAAIGDSSVVTKEQKALRVPVWIKLERRGNQYYGYYATDRAGKEWTPITWGPQVVEMPRTICAGLAVCSLKTGAPCEAKFSNVTICDTRTELTHAEILSNPEDTLAIAYENLEQLGNWRADPEVLRNHGDMIARSLFAIARVRELRGEAAQAVLLDYRRIVELLPQTPSAVEALIRIAILPGETSLEYARQHIEAHPLEDRDRFYVAVLQSYIGRPSSREREAAFKSFVEYIANTARFTALEQVIANLEPDEQGMSACRSLLQCDMAQPSNVKAAVVGLRYMALKTLNGQPDTHIQDLLHWASIQFKGMPLGVCATAALADICYVQGCYAKIIDTFQPGLLSENQSEAQVVETLDNILASYRANTLLQATIVPERIYEAVSHTASQSGRHVIALHCQRRIADLKGWSLKDFEQSARRGVKYCDSGPANEVWFWRGLIAAGEGDLGTAATAYEHFLQGDGKSVLSARAYYDLARAKMALGEDATEWISKARALSPCEAVIQLERRLARTTSTQG